MHRSVMTVLISGAVLIGAANVQAENWWERGRELLQGLEDSSASALSTTDIASGLREALRVGTGNVISRLGQENGFYRNAKAHIPLPDSLAKIRDALEKVGMSDQLDELELRMNRAAEAATPRAKVLFVDAIQQMTLDDARRIYNGPDDAATRYFQSRMSTPLADEFTPIVEDGLAQVGAVRTYDRVMEGYQQIPFVPDVKADLSEHVVDHAIETIFDYLAIEETAIRHNPAKRTTELLQKVFGS